MSEKRFELVEAIYNEVSKQQIEIMDNLEKQIVDKQKVADLLNEQQEEIEELIITIKLYEADIIEKDNKIKQLKQQLDKIPPRIKEIWLNG